MTDRPSQRFNRAIAAIDWLTDLGGLAGALSLLGIFVFIGGEIVSRNIFGVATHFSWDMAGYLMGTCFLFSCAAAMKGGSHVRVTALLEIVPRGLARVLELFSCIVGFAICIMLSWALIDMAWLSGLRGSTAATAFRVPLVYPQSALAAGAVLLTLQCAAQFLRLKRGEELTTGPGLE
jgi:TRAP-type C4-dicarboxylate transport system permease small subunit